MKKNDLFEGAIAVDIAAQEVTTRAQRRLIADAFGDGHDVPQEVRFACRIAMDVNAAIADGIEFEDGQTLVPNPKARAQFGKNARGLPYLTFGMINADDPSVRYTFRWEGASVPIEMVRTAIAHDEGRNVKATTVHLPFERAKVRPAGGTHARGTRRDIGSDGVAYPRPERRNHSRICRSDLETIQALRKAHTN